MSPFHLPLRLSRVMKAISSFLALAGLLAFTGSAQVFPGPAQAEPQDPEDSITVLAQADLQNPEEGIQVMASVDGINAQSSDDGIEVLARGPVHEAYAEPVAGAVGATPIIARQPPSMLTEVPADQKPE